MTCPSGRSRGSRGDRVDRAGAHSLTRVYKVGYTVLQSPLFHSVTSRVFTELQTLGRRRGPLPGAHGLAGKPQPRSNPDGSLWLAFAKCDWICLFFPQNHLCEAAVSSLTPNSPHVSFKLTRRKRDANGEVGDSLMDAIPRDGQGLPGRQVTRRAPGRPRDGAASPPRGRSPGDPAPRGVERSRPRPRARAQTARSCPQG